MKISIPRTLDRKEIDTWRQDVVDRIGAVKWIAVTFENTWVNYHSSFQPAAYCKDGMGFVHLQGLVKDGTDNSIIFTLPVGYRPAHNGVFCVISNSIIGRVDISAGGAVKAEDPSSPDWISLEDITFYAG